MMFNQLSTETILPAVACIVSAFPYAPYATRQASMSSGSSAMQFAHLEEEHASSDLTIVETQKIQVVSFPETTVTI
jgi:hypothetical protein